MGSCISQRNTSDDNDVNIINDHLDIIGETPIPGYFPQRELKSLKHTIDKLVFETLEIIGTTVDNETQIPSSLALLHTITDNHNGWIEMVKSLIRVVPVDHPMGPSVIALLLDDSSLPSKGCIVKVSKLVEKSSLLDAQMQRNLCVILGCLAEKLCGPYSNLLLNSSTLRYLIKNLVETIDHSVTLLSIIALEKFAKTSENKVTIKKYFAEMDTHPLLILEQYASSKEFLLRQIGFSARWSLDNIFLIEGRPYSYETVQMDSINAMLNTKDVSEYLKISADGLEARCDSYTFESVRCTYEINEGCWYYEVEIVTPGIMQIGWCSKASKFLSEDGYGIGDDRYSIAFDGCRKLIWQGAKSTPHKLPSWCPGDILGCLIDLNNHEVIFSLNGKTTDSYTNIFQNISNGFYAAGSFMSFQQCRFNFGLTKFSYPPERAFKNFNDVGVIDQKCKINLPRHLYIGSLKNSIIPEDSCSLCFDSKAVLRLEPCGHRGFCETCVRQLSKCPLCRTEIKHFRTDPKDSSI